MHCGNGVKQLKMDNIRNYYCTMIERCTSTKSVLTVSNSINIKCSCCVLNI